ncbi:MAG: wax ester/triacylglycerol synthase family O-acyltransferase [Parvularculaceae bacterium]|jgi:WS/DGAT/MGAT family acyltransferase|nr:wax ester/triacylglycerol synthase family O-acyltransferase [Parvularculaceae bacterium]
MARKLRDVIKEWSPQQLTGLDASFYYAESPRTPMHIGALAIYDPSTAPGGFVRFKDILSFIESRLHCSKTFRRKLKTVPLGLDHPYWIDDPEFDIEFHVRHIALPKPGDWRQLCIQAARLHARALDLSKPLWELTVIEGLDNIPNVPKGSYAIVSKIHHCAIDGASGVDITEALHSLEPDADPVEPGAPWSPGRRPGALELLARANWNNAVKPFHALDVARRIAPGTLKFAAGLTRGDIKLLGAKIPRTRFNGIVSAHKAVEATTFKLEDVKAIRQRIPGVTVNDVMLAVVGGALRRYLKAKDELPADSLIAMAPVSVRKAGEKNAAGNEVTALSIPLGTHVADPLARLHFAHEKAKNQKAMSNAVGARELADMSKLAPAMITGVATRLYSRLGLANRLSPMFNTVVTNVPGPQAPLYMAGARLTASYGLGPVMDSMGLFHAVTSYCGEIAVTITACRKMMPDPAFYRECLEASFTELYEAATGPRDAKKRPPAGARKREEATRTTNGAPSIVDDLTKIEGVGEKLAKRLNAAGVIRFAQIAALSEEDATALEARLGLKGRIKREAWIEQAAALAEGRTPQTRNDASVH